MHAGIKQKQKRLLTLSKAFFVFVTLLTLQNSIKKHFKKTVVCDKILSSKFNKRGKVFMKKFFSDFKKFIARGNILDMAVGVVVGGAFSKIVTSLVNDIIMPLVSLAMGGASVADWKWVIKEATYDANGILLTAETALKYGNFIQLIIDFLIVAFCIFIVLRFMMKAQNMRREWTLSKAEIKALRKQGKSFKEIEAIDEAKKAEIKAAEDAKKAAEPKPETVESLLKDIKVLLSEKESKKE